jgi:hypothetical protein
VCGLLHCGGNGLEEPWGAGAAPFANLRNDELLLRIDDEDAAGEGVVSDGVRPEQQVFGAF